MCNSYSVTKAMLKEARRAGQLRSLMNEEEDWKLIRPTLPGPVMRAETSEIMRWGFHRLFSNAVNNTRSDKLDSPMWRAAFAERRCVIPVSGFFEYSGPQGKKQAHEFTARNGELLWVAGIWEENATLGRCYSMIMTDANDFVSTIHNRMPALLHMEDLDGYLATGIPHFEPATVELAVRDVANPLKRKASAVQEELF